MDRNGVLVVLSGGQDSTTCLFWAKRNHSSRPLHAVTFDYGQRHKIEIESARVVARMARVLTHEVIELPANILASTSPLVSSETLEQYEDFNSLPGGLEKTFVPMRNQLFLTIATNRAIALGCSELVTGVCQEDFGGYPDCRRVFIEALHTAQAKGCPDGVNPYISTPLMDLSKAASVRLARTLPGCWEALAYTHTSYDGAFPPTGKDHATLLRAKGFFEAGFPDPLVMRAVQQNLMRLPETSNYDDYRGG